MQAEERQRTEYITSAAAWIQRKTESQIRPASGLVDWRRGMVESRDNGVQEVGRLERGSDNGEGE